MQNQIYICIIITCKQIRFLPLFSKSMPFLEWQNSIEQRREDNNSRQEGRKSNHDAKSARNFNFRSPHMSNGMRRNGNKVLINWKQDRKLLANICGELRWKSTDNNQSATSLLSLHIYHIFSHQYSIYLKHSQLSSSSTYLKKI